MKYLKRYNEGIFDFLKNKKEEPRKEEPKKEEPKVQRIEPRETREDKINKVLGQLHTLSVFRDKLLDIRGVMFKISYDDSDFTITSRQGYIDLINKVTPEGINVDTLTVKFNVDSDLVVSDVVFDIEYTIDGDKKKAKLVLLGGRYDPYLQEVRDVYRHNRFALLHELLYQFERHDNGIIRHIKYYFDEVYSKVNILKFRKSFNEEILDDIFADIKDISDNLQIKREDDWVGFTVSFKMKGIQPMDMQSNNISKFILNNKITKIFAELPSIEGRLKDIHKNTIIYVTLYRDAMSFSIVPKLENKPTEESIDEGLLSFFKKPKPKKIDIDVLKELLQSDLEDVKFGYDVKAYDVMEQINITEDDFVCDKNGHPILYDVNGKAMSMYNAQNAKNKTKGFIIYLLPKSAYVRPIGVRSASHMMEHINKERMKEYGIGYCLYYKLDTVGILFYSL